jgi:hypothetical protein
MSTTRSSSKTPDGRFELRYRCKDSWGDFANMEEDHRLVDAEHGELAHWTGIQEDDRGVKGATFTPDFSAVRVTWADDRVEEILLPLRRARARRRRTRCARRSSPPPRTRMRAASTATGCRSTAIRAARPSPSATRP